MVPLTSTSKRCWVYTQRSLHDINLTNSRSFVLLNHSFSSRGKAPKSVDIVVCQFLRVSLEVVIFTMNNGDFGPWLQLNDDR